MNCMKCGREVDAGQVFCERCLTEMEKYPVKPNAVVQLPRRPVAVKKTHQRRISAEDQVIALRKRCRRLAAALVLSVLLALGLAAATGIVVYELDVQRFLGKNYSITESNPAAEGIER